MTANQRPSLSANAKDATPEYSPSSVACAPLSTSAARVAARSSTRNAIDGAARSRPSGLSALQCARGGSLLLPDHTDIAQRWLRWADEDLALAEHIIAGADVARRVLDVARSLIG